MTELENSRYLLESFIASINVVISDNEKDDVIISTQKKKWDSNYNKKHANSFTFLCSLEDSETPEILWSSDNKNINNI